MKGISKCLGGKKTLPAKANNLNSRETMGPLFLPLVAPQYRCPHLHAPTFPSSHLLQPTCVLHDVSMEVPVWKGPKQPLGS